MTKSELLKHTLESLRNNPATQYANIKFNIEQKISRELNDNEMLLLQEVLWDLIAERVLTPGMNSSNMNWPFVRVTGLEKLNKMLSEI